MEKENLKFRFGKNYLIFLAVEVVAKSLRLFGHSSYYNGMECRALGVWDSRNNRLIPYDCVSRVFLANWIRVSQMRLGKTLVTTKLI